MSEEKTLEDVIGFLINVAEFDLEKTKRVPIPGGAMTVVSENYQYMSEVIDWIEDKIKEPELNDNQESVLEWLKTYTTDECITPIDTVASFWRARNRELQPEKWRLTKEEQAQVLQAFATWALDQCK